VNEDYLWDKSGDPDPEIEQLEKTLAPLRFERGGEPLPFPSVSRWKLGRAFSPSLAVAASLMFLILAGGLWFGLRSWRHVDDRASVAAGAPRQGNASEESLLNPQSAPPAAEQEKPASDTTDPGALVAESNANKLLRPLSGPRRTATRHPRRKASSRQAQLASQGENAKAQLILALHIASDKLSAVQKKIQASPGT